MNIKLLLVQSLGVVVGVGLAGLMLIPKLSSMEIPLIGGLTFCYVLITFHRNPFKRRVSVGHDIPTIAILSTVILLLIISTGGLSSLLFFLLYFLLFSISFVLLPEVVFVFTASVIILFLPTLLSHMTPDAGIKLGSLLLFSPLAYFFGKIFESQEQTEKYDTEKTTSIVNTAEQIKTDISELLLQQQASLKAEEVEKLQDAIVQSDTVEKLAQE
jgi:hypothetical protein